MIGRIARVSGGLALCVLYLRTLGLPSIWLDEAWEVNYYIGIVDAPWYHRPMLYMASEKAMAAIFGPGEFALRLLPCLAGISAVVATFVLARRLAGEAAAWIAAALLALSSSYLAYAHQVKHYTYDVLFTVLLILLYERYREAKSRRSLTIFAVVACVSLGFSFTTPFIIAGITAVEAAEAFRSRRWPERSFFVATATVGIVFVVLFLAAHARDVSQPYLQAYFAEAWLPLGSPAEIPHFFVRQATNILSLSGGLSVVAVALIVAAGVWSAVRKDRGALIGIFAVAMAANLVASAVHLYPFGDTRTSLYLAPIVCCIAAFGLTLLLESADRRVAVVALIGALYPLFGFAAVAQVRTYLTTGRPVEDIRGAATLVAREAGPEDGIVVTESAIPPFIYYWYRAGRGTTIPNSVWIGRHRKDPEVNIPPMREAAAHHDTLWCYFYFTTPEETAVLEGALAPTHDRIREAFTERAARLEVYRRR